MSEDDLEWMIAATILQSRVNDLERAGKPAAIWRIKDEDRTAAVRDAKAVMRLLKSSRGERMKRLQEMTNRP